MHELLSPLVTADVDLKDFPYTPIFRARLFGSSFHATATDAEWRAGVTLWLRSWDQVPAGSLPQDEVQLCRLAELGRDMKTWRKVRLIALHGWAAAPDGRLYHEVVAEGVNAAWQSKRAQRDRTAKAREARLSQNQNPSVTEPKSVCHRPENTSQALCGEQKNPSKGREEKGKIEEDSEATASGADAPGDPVKEFWDRALALVGTGNRSFIGGLRKTYGPVIAMEAIVATEAEKPSEPVSYLVGYCKWRKENAGSRTHASAMDILARAAIDHDERQGDSGLAETAH